MKTFRPTAKWRGTTYEVAVPLTRAPFVNTPLLSLGRIGRRPERFWISTYARDGGCLGVLVDETGDCRVLPFDESHRGFYSAVLGRKYVLWLCGDPARMVRLDLRTMRSETYSTGAREALLFQGMIFDPPTGKLFAAAFPGPDTAAVSFDTRRQKAARFYDQLTPLHYMRFSFPNGNGTWSFVMHTPGVGLLLWDPRRERVQTVFGSLQTPANLTYRLISDGEGRWYFPELGWYDPRRRRFAKARPAPQREMGWFATRDGKAYGAVSEQEKLAIGCWDFSTGKVSHILTADCQPLNVNLAASGRLVAVDLHGTFFRWDAATGALEQSIVLPADVVNHTDRVCRIGRHQVLGTPFISQRFWVADLRTGKGQDCGRAAPGFGEVLATWRLRGKAYMAAYTGGELTEFDPSRPARYPENPRVVADPPRGMRPIAWAEDERCLYYSCSAPYGLLGCTLTRYDTVTGAATYAENPLPGQSVCSLYCDRKRRALFAGTTVDADCQSRPAEEKVARLARFGAATLALQASVAAPAGMPEVRVIGPLGPGRWLCTGLPDYNPLGDRDAAWFAVNFDRLRTPDASELRPFPRPVRRIEYAGRPGLFAMLMGPVLELWNLRATRCVRRLADGFTGYSFKIQDRSVYLLDKKKITVLEDCLR